MVQVDTKSLTDQQKSTFANAAYEAKKNNPEISWRRAFEIANESVPEYVLPKTINSPDHLAWVRDIVARLSGAGPKRKTAEKLAAQKNYAEKVYELRHTTELTWTKIFKQVNKEMAGQCSVGETITGIKQVKWLSKLYSGIVQQNLLNAVTAPAQTGKTPEPEKISGIDDAWENRELGASEEHVAVADDNEQAEIEVAIENKMPVESAFKTLEAVLIEAIVGAVKPIVLNILQSPQFAEALKDAFKDARPAIGSITNHPAITQALQPQRTSKKRIMVIGLRGDQANEIRREWGEVFNLNLFDSDVSSKRIRQLMQTHEKTIVMTKFIAHRVTDCLKGVSGLTYCNGTESALKEILNAEAHINGH